MDLFLKLCAAAFAPTAGFSHFKNSSIERNNFGVSVLQFSESQVKPISIEFAAAADSRSCTKPNAAGHRASAVIEAVETVCAGANRYIPAKAFDRLRQREWIK